MVFGGPMVYTNHFFDPNINKGPTCGVGCFWWTRLKSRKLARIWGYSNVSPLLWTFFPFEKNPSMLHGWQIWIHFGQNYDKSIGIWIFNIPCMEHLTNPFFSTGISSVFQEILQIVQVFRVHVLLVVWMSKKLRVSGHCMASWWRTSKLYNNISITS